MVFVGAFAWVYEGSCGFGADSAGVVGLELVVEDYFGLLDVKMVRLLELSPFSTHADQIIIIAEQTIVSNISYHLSKGLRRFWEIII